MKTISYVTGALLLVAWVIALIRFNTGLEIHILLAFGILLLLFGFYKEKSRTRKEASSNPRH